MTACSLPLHVPTDSATMSIFPNGLEVPPVRDVQHHKSFGVFDMVCILLYSTMSVNLVWAFRATASLGRLQETFPFSEVGHGALLCRSTLRPTAPVRCTYTAGRETPAQRSQKKAGLMGANTGDGILAARELMATNGGTRTALRAMQSRKSLVGGNWKCNGTLDKTEELVEMLNAVSPSVECVDVIVAPPSLFACQVKSSLRKPMQVAAQDSSLVPGYGAYTGELSAKMLRDAGIEWVVLGHSERRAGFGGAQPGESNEVVAAKVKAALDEGLNPILCIGETLAQRERGETHAVLSDQLKAVRATVPENEKWSSIVIAYEPVWAIGTGRTATPQQAQDTHEDIRDWLRDNVSAAAAAATRIIYGGSVKGSNAEELFKGKDVDGFLVGGASLTKDFQAILQVAASPKDGSAAAVASPA